MGYREITTTGTTGDSTKATKEKGEKILACVTEYVVNLIKEMEKDNRCYDYRK